MQLQQIAHITTGTVVGDAGAAFSKIVIDSRKVISVADSLFVALRGENHDGHWFVRELAERGVTGFVLAAGFDLSLLPAGANAVLVADTLVALQQLAAAHRREMDYPVLAVTGSNGKTIVKEWIAQLAADTVKVIRSPKSFNSQVGVPLSLLLLEEGAQLGVIEAGISRPGEMARLEAIISPSMALVTNIGQAHQENFESLEAKLAEKALLLQKCDTIYYCADQELVHRFLTSKFTNDRLVAWGSTGGAFLTVKSMARGNGQTVVDVVVKGQSLRFVVPFVDHGSVEDAMHALTFWLHRGLSAELLAPRLLGLKPVAMRLEQKEGVNNCLVINDTYNSDITSLEVALDFMNQQARQKEMQRTVVLSDILQSGLSQQGLYHRVNELMVRNGVSQLIGVGADMCREKECFTLPARFFESTGHLLTSGVLSSLHKQVVLVKGSRDFGFERVVDVLEKKRHQTVLEVNLTALAHNVNRFRAQLKPGTKLLAMVKAFSYGSGSFEIAGVLQHQKVDYLGVAFADEGVELRHAGITLPIVVMNPEKRSFPVMLQYALEPEVYSFSLLEGFSQAVAAEGLAHAAVHIKIDTGMMRVGFLPHEVPGLCRSLEGHPNLRVQSVFSHLAGSENPVHDEFTYSQIALFDNACSAVSNTVGYPFLRHILNSAGIERFPGAQYEMVRLGIGLYGISAKENSGLRNVATLKSYISQIKPVAPHQTVGYGRRGLLPGGGTIGIVPIGYADGLDRRLGNGVGKMMVNKCLVPIVGSVCMDLCMVDLTGVNAGEGDEVVVFGDDYPVWEQSDAMGTIPYEVLTGIGRRVPRVYFQE